MPLLITFFLLLYLSLAIRNNGFFWVWRMLRLQKEEEERRGDPLSSLPFLWASNSSTSSFRLDRLDISLGGSPLLCLPKTGRPEKGKGRGDPPTDENGNTTPGIFFILERGKFE